MIRRFRHARKILTGALLLAAVMPLAASEETRQAPETAGAVSTRGLVREPASIVLMGSVLLVCATVVRRRMA